MTLTSNNISHSQQQRIALLLEYNGSAFSGSQFQPGQPTVQQAVMDALAKLNLDVSGFMMSGRTDAGVHARGQVAHFDIPAGSLQNIPNLVVALNAILPETVRVRDDRVDVGADFNSQRSAEYKWYRYTVYNASQPSVWAPLDSVWVKHPLDVSRMDQAAQRLLGTHNFKSFKCPDTPILDDVCHVYHAGVRQEGNLVIFDIVANRFLYKMVRNLMGQLLVIGKQGLSPHTMTDVLAYQDRTQAAAIAKANGLSLMAVKYQEGHHFFESDPYVRFAQALYEQTSQIKTESMQNENLFRKAS